jgi:hypothetical protein
MKKRRALSAFLVFSLFLLSCSSTREIRRPPALRFVDMTLSKEIEAKTFHAVPKNPTTIFSPKDPEVVAFLKLENLWGVHTLRWDWFEPDGNLYYSTGDYPLKSSEGKYLREVTMWHKLSIRGEEAGNRMGDWTVKILFDKEVLASRNFRIEMEVEELPEIARRPNQKYWGFIISLENYHRLPSVNYARKDAFLMKQYFVKVLGIPEANIIYLEDREATKAKIMQHLRTYFPRNTEKDSLLYVYFVGHGVLDERKENPYIIPYDGDVRLLEDTNYRLQDFFEDLENLQTKRSFVFLDTSFNGFAARNNNMILPYANLALNHNGNLILSSDKVIAMISSSGGQSSNAYPEKGHGLFTYFLLRGLRGEAFKSRSALMTMGELYTYVKDQVAKVSLARGMEQTPTLTPSLDKVKDVEIERE